MQTHRADTVEVTMLVPLKEATTAVDSRVSRLEMVCY